MHLIPRYPPPPEARLRSSSEYHNKGRSHGVKPRRLRGARSHGPSSSSAICSVTWQAAANACVIAPHRVRHGALSVPWCDDFGATFPPDDVVQTGSTQEVSFGCLGHDVCAACLMTMPTCERKHLRHARGIHPPTGYAALFHAGVRARTFNCHGPGDLPICQIHLVVERIPHSMLRLAYLDPGQT